MLDILEVSRGNVARNSFEVVTGKNPDVDAAAAPVDIWPGIGEWNYPTVAAQQVRLTSTSEEDKPSGTGAPQVLVTGVAGDFTLQSESVTLDGGNDALTQNNYLAVNSLKVTTGAGATNVGQVEAKGTAVGAHVFSLILAGEGHSRVACYHVPAAHTAWILGWNASVADELRTAEHAMTVALRVNLGDVFHVLDSDVLSNRGTGAVSRDYRGGIEVLATSVIRVTVESLTTDNMTVHAGLQILLAKFNPGRPGGGGR